MSTPLAIKMALTDTGFNVGPDKYNAVYDFIKIKRYETLRDLRWTKLRF